MCKRRLQPLAGPYFALVAEAVPIAPSAALHQQFDGLFNLPLIGIAFFDHRNRNAVRAENDLRVLRVRESCQRLVYLLDQRLQVELVTIEGLDAMDGMSPRNRRFHSFRLLPVVVLEYCG